VKATTVKILRNYQITIPAEVRKRLPLREGMLLLVELEGEKIILRPARPRFPTVRLGRKITEAETERATDEAMGEATK